jgi:hypothetical protein
MIFKAPIVDEKRSGFYVRKGFSNALAQAILGYQEKI